MKKLVNIFLPSSEAMSLGYNFRKKRMFFFKSLIQCFPKPITILDVGGHESFWTNASCSNNADFKITILNLSVQKTISTNIESVVGDAADLSFYDDNEFDIVFSNSVIEHLGVKQSQVKMAQEVCRAGRFHFVQTPNKYFCIESHYLLPFFQFLPKQIQYYILVNTRFSRLVRWDKERAIRYTNEIKLLSGCELKELFPESAIFKEKFLFMNKSFIAHNFL